MPQVTYFVALPFVAADDGIAALRAGVFEHPAHHLVAALGEVASHALQLTAEHRLQPGAELGEGVAGADGEAEDLATHPLDLPAGDLIGRD